MESTARAADPFEAAMSTLHAAGIDFEVVDDDHDPPDKTKPPPGEEDGSESVSSAASPERVTDEADTKSRRVRLSEWRQALRGADLTATEHHVALAYADHMAHRDDEAHCWPSAELIAKETHRSRATVYKALGSLESKGWVLWERRSGSAPMIWATVPDGGDVIRFPRQSHPQDTRDSLTHETRESHPRDTEASNEVANEVSAAASFTDAMYQAMLTLADESGARSPKAWVAKVYADDIAPIIEQRGPDAALAEIRRRIEAQRPKRRTRHFAPEEDHGSDVVSADNW